MKSIGKRNQSIKKLFPSILQPSQPSFTPREKRPFAEDESPRYTEFQTRKVVPSPIKQNRQSRMTQIKSEYVLNRNRSITPPSRVTQNHEGYLTEFQIRYKQLEQILKKQNENFYQQNQFLKQQIRRLYDRQTKHKRLLKKYESQIKFLQVENQMYQQRHLQMKTYVNTVIDKISQITEKSEIVEDKNLLRNSSIQLVSRLKLELDHYEDWKDLDDKKKISKIPSQKSLSDSDLVFGILPEQIQNITVDFSPPADDLQESRHSKENNTQLQKNQSYSSRKPPKPSPMSKKEHNDLINHPITQFSEDSNPSNSDSNTVDVNFKTINYLQDTSQSNSLNYVNQQIEELTDQSEALMYELKQKGNHDAEIKKKIMRISQKIRQLKMQTQNSELHKFSSVQNIGNRN